VERQFEDLKASELYCPKCRTSRPVRERLLLVLPHAELHEYRCTACAESLGTREVKAPPPMAIPQPVPRKPAPARRR
jgi:hypothetical protein